MIISLYVNESKESTCDTFANLKKIDTERKCVKISRLNKIKIEDDPLI